MGPAGAAAEVVAGALVLVARVVAFVGVDVVRPEALLDVDAGGGCGLDEPEPTDVVSEPDSM